MLSSLPSFEGTGDLLVGTSTADDAAVLRIQGDQAIVQTVDFFTPIVDDPFVFGSIAAANSVSDIYAMGARPILGLAITAFPTDKLPLDVLHEILRGGAAKAAEAGFPVAGGHTIIDDVPKYGLAVTGIARVADIVRNSTSRVGDLLYLTKPIGNGILVCAYRALNTKPERKHEPPNLDKAVEWMTMLNREASAVMVEVGVDAATDVSGYGLVGHLLGMCDGAGVGAEVHVKDVPLLEGAREYLGWGYRPGGTIRNAEGFRRRVRLSVPEEEYMLMCDAQTSGGLLMAVSPQKAGKLEKRLRESGVFYAKVGSITDERGVVALVP